MRNGLECSGDISEHVGQMKLDTTTDTDFERSLQAQPSPHPARPDLRVGFILSPKFTLLPLASFIDCMRHAADEGDRSRQLFCSWKVIGPERESITASCGLQVMVQEVFPDPSEFDYIVVVGGLLPGCLELPDQTYGYLQAARAANVAVAGLCTGSFILATAGLLDGRICAVHFEHAKQLTAMFPKVRTVTDQPFVIDGDVITCPGGTAALDLAAALVEEHCGKVRAVKGLISMLAVNHREDRHTEFRPYGNLAVCGNWRVEKSIELMERNVSRPFGIAELAHRLGSSVRELNRAFADRAGDSPTSIWRKMRLAHGRWLLINTSRTVTQIAFECGFSDAAHFSRWFRRAYGEAPNSFRRQRRGP